MTPSKPMGLRAYQHKALAEIDQNPGYGLALIRQIDPGDYIRLVFLAGEGLGLFIGCLFGEGINRPAP